MIAGTQESNSIHKSPQSDESSIEKHSTTATIGLQQISFSEEELTDSTDGYQSQQQTPPHLPHMIKNVSRNIPEFVPKIASNWLFSDDVSPLSGRIPAAEGSLTINIPQLCYRQNCEKFIGYMAAKSYKSEILDSTPLSVESPGHQLWLVRLELNHQKNSAQLDRFQIVTEQQSHGLVVRTSAAQARISKKKEEFEIEIEAGAKESLTLVYFNKQPVGQIQVKSDELCSPVYKEYRIEKTTVTSGESVVVQIEGKRNKFRVAVKIVTSVLGF